MRNPTSGMTASKPASKRLRRHLSRLESPAIPRAVDTANVSRESGSTRAISLKGTPPIVRPGEGALPAESAEYGEARGGPRYLTPVPAFLRYQPRLEERHERVGRDRRTRTGAPRTLRHRG